MHSFVNTVTYILFKECLEKLDPGNGGPACWRIEKDTGVDKETSAPVKLLHYCLKDRMTIFEFEWIE